MSVKSDPDLDWVVDCFSDCPRTFCLDQITLGSQQFSCLSSGCWGCRYTQPYWTFLYSPTNPSQNLRLAIPSPVDYILHSAYIGHFLLVYIIFNTQLLLWCEPPKYICKSSLLHHSSSSRPFSILLPNPLFEEVNRIITCLIS